MQENPNRRRLRELEAMAKEVQRVLDDMQQQIRELRQELGLSDDEEA